MHKLVFHTKSRESSEKTLILQNNARFFCDAIWKKTVDKYAGNGITVEASAFIMAVYDFAPDALNRHVTLSPKLISKLIDQNTDRHAQSSHNGTVVGGYITELLYEELGQKVNGRLRALKNKIARTL